MHTYEVTIILKGNKRIVDTVKASTKQNAKAVIEARYPGANVRTPKKLTSCQHERILNYRL